MKRVTSSIVCRDKDAEAIAECFRASGSDCAVTIENVEPVFGGCPHCGGLLVPVEPEPGEPWYIADTRQVMLRLAMQEVRTSAQEAWLNAVTAICEAYDAARMEGK